MAQLLTLLLLCQLSSAAAEQHGIAEYDLGGYYDEENESSYGEEETDDSSAAARSGRQTEVVWNQDVADKVPEGPAVLVRFRTADAEAEWPESESCPPVPQQPSGGGHCQAVPCRSDADCTQRPQHYGRCCFNGCVRTCLRALDPPPAVDWVDETPYAERKRQDLQDLLVQSSAPAQLVALSLRPGERGGRGESGGCLLTPAEHLYLQDFRRGGHVRECYCSGGVLVCEVNAS